MSTAFQKNKDSDDRSSSTFDSMPDFQTQPMQQLAFNNPGQMNSLAQAIQKAAQSNAEMQVGPEYTDINPALLELLRQYQMGMQR